jgi:hypothetical protein
VTSKTMKNSETNYLWAWRLYTILTLLLISLGHILSLRFVHALLFGILAKFCINSAKSLYKGEAQTLLVCN